MKNILRITALCSIFFFFLSCGNKQQEIQGQWMGTATMSGQRLNVLFDFEWEGNELQVKFYSIDQTKQAFKSESAEFKNDMLQLKVIDLGVVYQGKLLDSILVGTITQAGYSAPLDLKKISKKEFDDFFQDHYNFDENDAYTSTNVEFSNPEADINLAGTISIPKNLENCPAVVLVTGSGPQNRDEELMGHKPFKRLADYLSSNGIAVLRYDDRGVASSGGDFSKATTYDLYSDALAAARYLKTYPGINPDKIGIIGHSEGGIIAMMAAAETDDVNFIVSLGGPILKGEDILLLQAKYINAAYGLPDSIVEQNNTLNSAVYAILKKVPDDKKAKLDIIATIKHYATNSEMKKDVVAERMANTVLNPWFRAYITLDPQVYVSKIKHPALFMFGEKDLQIPAKENIAAIKNKPENITIVTVGGVNHLFQNAIKGTPDEYSNPENVTINDETLSIIYTWLKNKI